MNNGKIIESINCCMHSFCSLSELYWIILLEHRMTEFSQL